MDIWNHIILTLLVYCFFNLYANGQSGSGKFCINAEPLCGASQFYYSNSSGYSIAESGPDYGCVLAQLNPSWFYMQISQDGDIQLKIEQSTTIGGTPDLDVDFVIYGPFNDPEKPCVVDLTFENIVDCNYLPDFVEYVNIPSTSAGEYYLLLITNFSLAPGFITVTQTAGSATTNCIFLEDYNIVEEKACSGDVLTLNAITQNAESYIWYEKNENVQSGFEIINGANTETYEVNTSNEYRVEVFDVNNVLIEKLQFNVFFLETPKVPTTILDYSLCDIENDGLEVFDLGFMDSKVLNGLSPLDYSVSYYSSLTEANSAKNQLPILYINTQISEIIYVRIDNITSNDIVCFEVGSFNIKLNPIPEIILEDNYIFCVNLNGTEEISTPPIIDTGLSNTEYQFTWYFNNVVLQNESKSTLIVSQEGVYTIEVLNLTTNCSYMSSTVVNISSPPTVSASVTSHAFIEQNVISATAFGEGFQDYEFNLDGGPWQLEGTFNNVSFGEHTVKARDINGCGTSSKNIVVMDYPLYFTPNGDGEHDTWNIVGISNQLQAEIRVYNRYGKLIKQLSPSGLGWDGTYNGKPLPTDDYWFTITFFEPKDGTLKQFKSHFALRR
ncbi:T9SS type B sorting domain-containing protein [Thalassobellus suaedae]|uniref:T9SS type B sorting domain-containing protein n=1 Tax=Thalassobellus suaedae TaxID=3074124 RepID=A0ABY9Y151_9FLAO|nr:T9SS type B sorting domain-containing protein [Flavobacteriaceae bacterium HL-DH10]